MIGGNRGPHQAYRVADKSVARPTSRCILFDGENIPLIMIINRIYRSADKSLARPGRKQATATEDFDFHIAYLKP